MALKWPKSLQFRERFASTVLERTQGSSRFSQVARRGMLVATVIGGATLAGRYVSAQIDPGNAAPSQPLASLKTVSIPQPSNLKDFIKDEKSAVILGKTLFWDMQVGSDGTMSCASCHFHAGVDSRSKNQVNIGFDNSFNTGGAPNYQLTEADYPFHKLSDPNDRSSNVLSDSDDITGSHGVFTTKFNAIIPGSGKDDTTVIQDPIFNISGTNVRQVTGRHAPSTINAVFNFRNFWDGRAQNEFNGVNPFGDRDPNARVLKEAKKGQLEEVRVSINNSSLASQAVGPPLSDVEESGTGRLFPDIGEKFNRGRGQALGTTKKKAKKLRLLVPLGRQLVDKDDSVLGKDSQYPTPGLKTNYAELVKKAFKDEWWKSETIINVDANGQKTFVNSKGKKKDIDGVTDAGQLVGNQFTLMDYNFSLFMGLAVQAYEATLVSDNSPFDQYMDAQGGKGKKGNSNALTAQQIQGKDLFAGKAKCLNCHGGGEFTNASVKNVENEKIERMVMGDRGIAIYDNGFYNIGVRPTGDDPGVGGQDPFGNPLSFSKYKQKQIEEGKSSAPIIKARSGENIPSGPLSPSERVSVDGSFKVPGLRNVELTAPYFHNGGKLTLRQVVEFYNRGGDFHEQNINNLDADIQSLGLSEDEKDSLVAFLVSLTDERVRYQQEPFDHPQLFIPFGHPGDQSSVTNDGTGQATDQLIEIPAVGRKGGAPLSNFLNVKN
jgi:cytochrome c peroxidase